METLILLPGVGCDSDFWQYQIQHLSDIVKTKVIVLDEQDSLEKMVEYVLANTPNTFSLAGHSLGGWAAQAIAGIHPERVQKLFLMSTWTQATPEFWHAIEGWIKRINNGELESILDNEIVPFVFPKARLSDHDLINRHQRMKKRMSAEKYVRQLQAMYNHPSVYDFLAKITAPTLIIHGRQDINFEISEQEMMIKQLKHGELALIEDCGHMSCMEQPQAVTALMRLWLTQKQ